MSNLINTVQSYYKHLLKNIMIRKYHKIGQTIHFVHLKSDRRVSAEIIRTRMWWLTSLVNFN